MILGVMGLMGFHQQRMAYHGDKRFGRWGYTTVMARVIPAISTNKSPHL